MNPVFSVIVPIYKVEPYLRKCVDSILTQTFTDFELLLVDDGSPDACPMICDTYAAQDHRVRVIHKENGGLVSARNTGIAAACGQYICYVDSDDWIAQNLLETVWKKAIEQHQPDMVIFGIVKKFRDRDEEILNDLTDDIYEKKEIHESICPRMMYDPSKAFCKGLIFPAACNKIYKRSLLQEHHCTEERIRMGEDNAFVYECVWYAEKIYICNEILYFYNQLNTGSMGNSYDPARFENNRILTDYMEHRLAGLSPAMDEQINAFKAYWLIMAVFHEVKNRRPLVASAAHIKQKIRQTKVLEGIHLNGLPLMAKGFLVLLRLRLYMLTLIASRIVNRKRGE